MKIDWMVTILAVAAVIVVISFWKAQKKPGFSFDLFDLIMDKGKVSAPACAFMLVLAVSTWVIVAQQLNSKLTDGTFGMWLAAWVAPLTAKFIFNKSDMPGTTSTTSMTQTTTEKSTP